MFLFRFERQSEIDQLGLVVGSHQDVRRLDVAMDDSLAVRAVERHAALEDDPDHPVQWQQLVDPGVVSREKPSMYSIAR